MKPGEMRNPCNKKSPLTPKGIVQIIKNTQKILSSCNYAKFDIVFHSGWESELGTIGIVEELLFKKSSPRIKEPRLAGSNLCLDDWLKKIAKTNTNLTEGKEVYTFFVASYFSTKMPGQKTDDTKPGSIVHYQLSEFEKNGISKKMCFKNLIK
jgi:bisphosphoglycerate-dependent phosphoglycerate mutase